MCKFTGAFLGSNFFIFLFFFLEVITLRIDNRGLLGGRFDSYATVGDLYLLAVGESNPGRKWVSAGLSNKSSPKELRSIGSAFSTVILPVVGRESL